MFNFKKNPIVYGTILLSCSGLICRGMGFFYRLFISQAFGEEAMGIFQLSSPVLMLAFSLTCAGMQTAISRCTAACIGIKNEMRAKKFLLAGCFLSFSLSLLYSIIVYGQAENISIYFLQEKRCAPLLKICAFTFPFSALHSCFNGYFYGKKETKIPSLTQILEQLIRIGSVLFLYSFSLQQNKTPTIALTCVGMLLGETASFLISFFYYLVFSTKKTNSASSIQTLSTMNSAIINTEPVKDNFFSFCRQLLSLSIPLTFSRVIVNLLQSYEAISIPAQLREYGYSTQTALSIYGVLTGMALSLVLFPSTFANSVSVLLLPTISEASSSRNYKQIKNTIQKSISFSLLLGFVCTLFFFFSGDILGIFLFNSQLASTFIRQLCFLCPFLYLHITLSSILNGLKKTKTTLFINTFSLLLRLFFIIYFIPLYGIKGYLWGLLLSEVISSLFCIFVLRKYFL